MHPFNQTSAEASQYLIVIVIVIDKQNLYILFTISKESRKKFYPSGDLNSGPGPQSKSDDLDRSAIGKKTKL